MVKDQVVENKGKRPPDVRWQSESPTISRFLLGNFDFSAVESKRTDESPLLSGDFGREPGHKDPIEGFRVKIRGSKALWPPTVSVIFVLHGYLEDNPVRAKYEG
jgi:hypothetical protein